MRTRFVWPWLVIAGISVITLFFGIELRGIRIQGGTVFLPPNSPVERQISRMERIFGSSEIMSVMMRQGGTIFTPSTLTLIEQIASELETLPGVEKVRSLAGSDYLRGVDGGMIVERLIPKGPVTPAVAAQVRRRSLSWEMYRGLFFSSDLKATQWVVTLDSSPQHKSSYASVVGRIREVIARHESPSRHFMVSGEVAVKALLVRGITKDLTFLLPILVVVLVGILFFAFRKPAGVILPLTTVVISTIWTMGLMALFGVPINIMGTAIPLLLVTVGSAYGIHFLSHYYEETGALGGSESAHSAVGGQSPTEALRRTFRRVGLPILLAGVTTIAGFGSLGSASVPAIFQMGIFTAVGILCALILTFSFVPAVLTLARRRSGASGARTSTLEISGSDARQRSTAAELVPAAAVRRDGRTARVLSGIYDLFAKRPVLLLVVVVALVGLSAIGISRIQIGQPTIDFFRGSSPIRAASRFADRNFGGSTIMYVLIRPASAAGVSAGASGTDASPVSGAFGSFGDLSKMAVPEGGGSGGRPGLTSPRVLNLVEGLENQLKTAYPAGVGRVSSLVTMIKQMNRVMHDGEEAYYEVPTDPKKYGLTGQDSLRRLIAQYLLLYSGNLSSFVNSTDSPTELRMVVQLKDSNPSFLQKVKQDIAVYADAHLRQLGYAVETVGLPDEMLAMNRSIMRSQVTSVSIALLCVLIAMWIAYRSFRVGLAGLIPIALSLLLNFAAMGFLHIPLDIVTAIIASVAVGIGIDYSIHVVSAYIFEYRLTGSTEEAAHRTLGLTGRAIFYNVMSVTLGFAVLVFSMFTPLNSVGILMGVIMLTSSFFSLTLLPVVLRAIVPRLVTGGSVRPAETISGTLTSETTNRRNK